MPKGDFIRKMALHRWKLNFFMLQQLPMGFLAGLRILNLDVKHAQVRIPFKYVNKNPFRSMYFASQSMAAELSTGIMAMAAVRDTGFSISMLVLEMKSSFLKKATTPIIFSCHQGQEIAATIQKAIDTNEGQIITVKSIGQNTQNEIVSEFEFTWTFKLKT